ncbi:hypothetical protein K9O30_17860 [Clostridium bowmanii]|uniref:hypothetical protein n=1 Tax=Clostridium bowmanii TaxID=132925 RepID=UPI001C0DF4E7|nr:hypothetical protein [Clostridium bowmanii]MBU3191159.1 hypothetical protein [Clostridium bowmanii]MCA1075550.1 hypothetical protein [Clostridium bowmanii]
MDIEKLVDMVIKEVMKRIPESAADTAMDKEKILVIGSCSEDLTIVEELLEHKYEVHIYDEEDINLRNYQHIIVTNLCNKGLASMALGLCNDNVQEFIVEALFNAKKLYILKEGIQYRKYSTNANEALYNLYKQYECKIMSYGASVVHEHDLLKNMEMGTNCNVDLAQKDSLIESSIVNSQGMTSSKDMNSKFEEVGKIVVSGDTLQDHQVAEISNKRLITESDLKKLYLNGIKEVKVIKKAILTPLAQDYVRIKRLQINRV